jgi:cyclic beta-1,2-glucan synthetase
VNRQDRLIRLLTPPFDKGPKNPGYIKGYPPGIRENGGHYTHAGVWTVFALASLGHGDKAVEFFNLLNPIHHGQSRAGIHQYKVEPYVVAADIYTEPPHVGRGGWTWYTGAAGWLYRAAVESILGFRLRGTTLFLDPCIPTAWPHFEIDFRYHSARYQILVENPKGVSRGIKSAEMDGKPIHETAAIPLVADGGIHQIRIILG